MGQQYVYVKAKGEHLWTVGFYDPTGDWNSESDWDSPVEAMTRVHYLNGGTVIDDQTITIRRLNERSDRAIELLGRIVDILEQTRDTHL